MYITIRVFTIIDIQYILVLLRGLKEILRQLIINV
jgi:hypothetical protein